MNLGEAVLPFYVRNGIKNSWHYHNEMFLDPGIGASEKPGTYPPYDRGLEMDIFVKNTTNQPFVGQVYF